MQINFSDGYLLSTSCNIVISFLLTVLLFNSNEEIYVSIYSSCFYRARIKYSSLTLKYVYIIYKSSCQFQFYVYSFLEQTKTRLISATADSGFRVVDFEFMYKISPCPLPPQTRDSSFLSLIEHLWPDSYKSAIVDQPLGTLLEYPTLRTPLCSPPFDIDLVSAIYREVLSPSFANLNQYLDPGDAYKIKLRHEPATHRHQTAVRSFPFLPPPQGCGERGGTVGGGRYHKG